MQPIIGRNGIVISGEKTTPLGETSQTRPNGFGTLPASTAPAWACPPHQPIGSQVIESM